MGKVLVMGKAEKKVAPDSCDITITVESRKNTSATAAKEISVLCEQLLAKLQKIGLELKKIEITNDNLSVEREYRTEKTLYQARKSIRIHTPSDSSVINTIKSVLEEGITGVSYSLAYLVSNEADVRKQLMKEAIKDSRRKADFLAESIGAKIIGVESANLTGNEDVYDVAEDDDFEENNEGAVPAFMRTMKCLGSAGSAYPLSDNLKPEEIEMEAHVKIVWLLSSD